MLEYLGYVPRSVIQCFSRIKFKQAEEHVDVRLLARPATSSLAVILKEDQDHFLTKKPELFIKVLALLSANKEVDLMDLGLSPGDLLWTLLKTNATNIFGGLVVSAVSPAAADAAKRFICDDRQGLKAYVKALHDMFSGTVGPISGYILAHVICRAMLEANKLEYYCYSAGGVQRGILDFTALQLSLIEDDSAVIPAELKKETLVHARHAKDFNLFATDSDGNSHAIQVSKQRWSTKCGNSQFYEETRYSSKYIVSTHVVSVESVKNAMARSEKLKTAMETHGLRVLDVYSYIHTYSILFAYY